MLIYVVNQGDTLYKIAEKYGIQVSDIVKNNELNESNTLVVGETLVLPVDEIKYVVKNGDTLYSISRKFGVPIDSILKSNPNITNPSNIAIGTTLILKDTAEIKRDIEVNGYALPGIDYDVLIKTLPNLTYLSIFSYEVNSDGTLKEIDDSEIISLAREKNVAPIMVVTNILDGGFSGDLVNTVLNDTNLKQNLTENILNVAKAKGYYGVNIDFEYINPSDKELYNAFIKEFATTLEKNNLKLFTSLAPKTSENQQGILYEAHDYIWHGNYVDRVILMTYEWGYSYGEPQAISPINPIKNVLNYASKVIPTDKILLGMSNYGYDWKLPFKKGDRATALSNTKAIDLAREVGSFIEYSSQAESPYFTYYSTDGKHIVWFDDARSYYARLKLVADYDLKGLSYWTINRYYPQNWLILNDLYNVVKVV